VVGLEILLVRSRGRLLCLRRPPTGRMSGLFEFPTRERVAAGAEARLWESAWPDALDPVVGEPLGELTHSITHHRIRATVRGARLRGRALPARARWVSFEVLADLPLTGLARKVLALTGRARPGAREGRP